jgi:DNA integrity scanning protein DisA with diadenylate cyclase activity
MGVPLQGNNSRYLRLLKGWTDFRIKCKLLIQMLENFNENDYMIQCTGHIVKMFRHSLGHRFQLKIHIPLRIHVVCTVFHVAHITMGLDSACKTAYEANNQSYWRKIHEGRAEWLVTTVSIHPLSVSLKTVSQQKIKYNRRPHVDFLVNKTCTVCGTF